PLDNLTDCAFRARLLPSCRDGADHLTHGSRRQDSHSPGHPASRPRNKLHPLSPLRGAETGAGAVGMLRGQTLVV
ncbi:unnamed protein product, partial [Mycena citricolor]